MPHLEIGLVARAKGVATHLLSRQVLETLAETGDLSDLAGRLSHAGTPIDSPVESLDVFAVERAIGRTANRYLQTLNRWQERKIGILDVFAARQDRRSIRAVIRGAADGAPALARLGGLLPTPTLPELALSQLAQQATPADVVRRLVALNHPDAPRLVPLIRTSQVDLLAIEIALLVGFVQRAMRAVRTLDAPAREFVCTVVDAGNLQTALALAGGPRDIAPAALFVRGGRWLSLSEFVVAVAASSQEGARLRLAAALVGSPLASPLRAVGGDLVHLDRALLTMALRRLTRAARIEPLSTAPLLRVLLLIEAQSRDLRALAWGAALGMPTSLRRQHLASRS